MGRRRTRRRADGSRESLTPDRPDTPTEGRFRHIARGGKVDPDTLRASVERADDEGGGAGVRPAGGETVSFTLQRDLDKRLDRYLVDRIAFLSRSGLQRLVEEGKVLVNGRVPKASTRVRKGDVVEVTVPPPPPTEIAGEEMPIDVVYEDTAILVLNKRADVIVHPARSHNSGTLLNGLVHYFASRARDGRGGGGLSSVGEAFARPGVVHRLDRDTTGVMVVAKDDGAHWRLARQFERRTTEKRYLAVVHGLVADDVCVIDVPLGPSPSRAKGAREKHAVRRDHLGKSAVTVCRVRERFESPWSVSARDRAAEVERLRALPSHRRDRGIEEELRRSLLRGSAAGGSASVDRGFTLVEVELKTGRTHQIRVHMSHIGHPIVGDDMYGGVEALRAGSLDASAGNGDEVLIERQALHAALLGFRHPSSGEDVVFEAPLRRDMEALIGALRWHYISGGVLEPRGCRVDVPNGP